ncbi:MAG: hypothetical protein M5R36_09055 [Deltaproteobacteria bacterium]|nr:hypothetical protein [Deltaproteobacteria bacterium]
MINPRAPAPEETEITFAGRTLWEATAGIHFFFNFVYYAGQLSAEGDRILADFTPSELYAGASDGVIDAERGLVHWVTWTKKLAAWDAEKLTVVRSIDLPTTPDRIVFDKKHGRLILTLPLLGELWVVDPEDYRVVERVETFFGARALALDERRDRLYIAGLTPYLEIRSLDDFSLIDRPVVPAWTHWITVDPNRYRVFLTTAAAGLCEIDLNLLEADPAREERVKDSFPIRVRRAAAFLLDQRRLHRVFLPE